MNQKSISIFIVALNICVFSFVLLAAKSSSAADDMQYEACAPKKCVHGPDIKYPFYLQGQQESYCGYPDFKIRCDGQGYPIVHIPENDYVVENIYYENNSVRVYNAAVLGEEAGCLPQIKNLTLGNETVGLSLVTKSKINILWNCNQSLVERLWRYKIISCDEGKGNNWSLVLSEESGFLNSALQECKENVVAPVEIAAGENDKINATSFKRGFELKWKVSSCDECEKSGGRCGFNATTLHFWCYCPDRPQAWECERESRGTRKSKTKPILITVIGGVAPMILVFMLILKLCITKKLSFCSSMDLTTEMTNHQNIEEFLNGHGSFAPKRFSYSQLKKITNSFKDELGKGGFGCVYKGKLRNGSFVAVKVLKELRASGEDFINEVASISRTSHVNIVTLIGFCIQGKKRALVYEFMPNGSLDNFIYDNKSLMGRKLGWNMLYKISIGVARGLEYLHRGCNTRILHLDIKPHNILLGEDFSPKISDFGLAKLCTNQESIVSILGARGTIGYVAPEVVCKNIGGVSHKSDVYSYGMVVLEMVGGRRNADVGVSRNSKIYFPHWIYTRLVLDDELGLIGVMNEEEHECARKMVIVSLWCIQTDPSTRPSMSRVLEMLEGKVEHLQIPPKPYLYSLTESEEQHSSPKPYFYSPSGSEEQYSSSLFIT